MFDISRGINHGLNSNSNSNSDGDETTSKDHSDASDDDAAQEEYETDAADYTDYVGTVEISEETATEFLFTGETEFAAAAMQRVMRTPALELITSDPDVAADVAVRPPKV